MFAYEKHRNLSDFSCSASRLRCFQDYTYILVNMRGLTVSGMFRSRWHAVSTLVAYTIWLKIMVPQSAMNNARINWTVFQTASDLSSLGRHYIAASCISLEYIASWIVINMWDMMKLYAPECVRCVFIFWSEDAGWYTVWQCDAYNETLLKFKGLTDV